MHAWPVWTTDCGPQNADDTQCRLQTASLSDTGAADHTPSPTHIFCHRSQTTHIDSCRLLTASWGDIGLRTAHPGHSIASVALGNSTPGQRQEGEEVNAAFVHLEQSVHVSSPVTQSISIHLQYNLYTSHSNYAHLNRCTKESICAAVQILPGWYHGMAHSRQTVWVITFLGGHYRSAELLNP